MGEVYLIMGKFYAVKKGRIPGIYSGWEECKANVDGYPNADYKSFKTAAEAAEYMGWTKEKVIHTDTKDTGSSPLYAAEAGSLTAYVDGSFNAVTKVYGSGAVLIDSGGVIVDRLCEKGNDEELASMRNVAGEIKGAESAMRYAVEKGYKKIVIYHDYEGIAKWCQGLWKTNKTGTINYKKLYDELSELIHIEFVKVKGHSGDKYNDMADALAKEAAGV